MRDRVGIGRGLLLLAAASGAAAGCGGGARYDAVAGSYAVTGSWEIARPDGTSEWGSVTDATIEVSDVRDGHAVVTFVGICGDTSKCSPFTMKATASGHEGDGTVFDVDGAVRLPAGTFETADDGDHDGNAAIDDASIKVDLLGEAVDGRVFRASFSSGDVSVAR
jgi:hypothetical protein